MLSRSSTLENQGQDSHGNGGVVDNDDNDDIQITSASSANTGIAEQLQNQHSRQRRRLRTENERQRLRQQRQQRRNRHGDGPRTSTSTGTSQGANATAGSGASSNIDDPIVIDLHASQEAVSGFYTNPNTHIQDDGPILITSDAEDLESIERNGLDDPGFHSDTEVSGSTSPRVRMALSADQTSIRNALSAQQQHLQHLINQQQQRENAPSIHEMDDDIQFVGERELPDLQILRSAPGYELHTPSGPLFVPTTTSSEIRSAGNRSRATMGRFGARTPGSSGFLGLVRSNRRATPSQHTLRQRQLEANRRARDAAGNTVADRVRRRPQRSSVRAGHELQNVTVNGRPRNHPILSLEGLQAYSNMYRFLHSLGFRDDSTVFQDVGGFPWISGGGDGGGNGEMENGDGSDVPANVMRILQNRDEERENQRIQMRNTIATTEKNKKAKEARVDLRQRMKFSNNLGEQGQTDVCLLCGVTLLQGIPENCFDEGAEDREKAVKRLVREGFISPWKAWTRFTKIEVDLSKKVFFGTCGHMYCGRCVNNIMKFRGLTARQRKDELNKTKKDPAASLDRVSAWDQNFENPAFAAPLKCIADGCTRRFTGKTPFNELYV